MYYIFGITVILYESISIKKCRVLSEMSTIMALSFSSILQLMSVATQKYAHILPFKRFLYSEIISCLIYYPSNFYLKFKKKALSTIYSKHFYCHITGVKTESCGISL